MIRHVLLTLLLTAGMAVPQAVTAAPIQATPKASATVGLISPLSVVLKDDLEFGFLAPGTTAGTAVMDPNSGALTTTGGVLSLGGDPHPAQFIGASRSASVVLIKLPNGVITLTRAGGTETMSLTNLTLQGQSKRALAAMESFTFNVGGTLAVGANQREGTYAGTFDVQIQYP